jgi:hypothetical protein
LRISKKQNEGTLRGTFDLIIYNVILKLKAIELHETNGKRNLYLPYGMCILPDLASEELSKDIFKELEMIQHGITS